MTTVAFRGGVIAADTLIAYNTFTNGQRCKIAHAGGFLVALAGPARFRKSFEKWVAAGADIDELPDNLRDPDARFEALIIDKNGQPFEFESGELVPVYADYTAIGSGAILAIGAMAHGATAEDAVVAAARHDKNTGGRVDAFHFSSLSPENDDYVPLRLN